MELTCNCFICELISSSSAVFKSGAIIGFSSSGVGKRMGGYGADSVSAGVRGGLQSFEMDGSGVGGTFVSLSRAPET